MIKALLHFKDGLPSGRIWLRSVVKNVQRGLMDAGRPMEADGKFGSGTRRAVETFQSARGLEASGAVDRATWVALTDHLQAATGARAAREAELLERFGGDLDWVHEREGHRGRPYWPGGNSGVTLDPGVDLGHASPELIEQFYGRFFKTSEMRVLRTVFGIRGEAARSGLRASPVMQGMRISSDQAVELMPHVAGPYWDRIRSRFPSLVRKDTPASVQMVLLSLAYNRGPLNPGLDPLGEPLQAKRWDEAARKIGSMQQSHKLEGIRIRRRYEAAIVKAELAFLNS